jgi:fructose-1,6-bisphosphatase/inositol monophosphatase family enzyme
MIIVREAGGHAVDFKGSSDGYSGKEILAAGPILSEMLERINAEWPKE